MTESSAGQERRVSGWRRAILDEAGSLRVQVERDYSPRIDRAYQLVVSATVPTPEEFERQTRQRAMRRVTSRLASRAVATDARQYEDALAALLALRRECLTTANIDVAAAHAPRIRAEVKQLVGTAEPAFDVYLRLLDRIEAAPGEPPSAEATSTALPSPEVYR